jgi:hypothetical protein
MDGERDPVQEKAAPRFEKGMVIGVDDRDKGRRRQGFEQAPERQSNERNASDLSELLRYSITGTTAATGRDQDHGDGGMGGWV